MPPRAVVTPWLPPLLGRLRWLGAAPVAPGDLAMPWADYPASAGGVAPRARRSPMRAPRPCGNIYGVLVDSQSIVIRTWNAELAEDMAALQHRKRLRRFAALPNARPPPAIVLGPHRPVELSPAARRRRCCIGRVRTLRLRRQLHRPNDVLAFCSAWPKSGGSPICGACSRGPTSCGVSRGAV